MCITTFVLKVFISMKKELNIIFLFMPIKDADFRLLHANSMKLMIIGERIFYKKRKSHVSQKQGFNFYF